MPIAGRNRATLAAAGVIVGLFGLGACSTVDEAAREWTGRTNPPIAVIPPPDAARATSVSREPLPAEPLRTEPGSIEPGSIEPGPTAPVTAGGLARPVSLAPSITGPANPEPQSAKETATAARSPPRPEP